MAARSDQARINLGRLGQRAVLGLLAIHPNLPVHRDHIIDALWGDDPPKSAVAVIHTHVSRLRSLLDARWRSRADERVLVTEGASYRLRVGADQLDLLAVEWLSRHARKAGAAGEAGAACVAYAWALCLWRHEHEPLADVEVLRRHPAVTALAARRAAIVTEFADAACGAGWYDCVLPELRALAARYPLDERVHARLMVALAGAAHQAEALRVYHLLRHRLDRQLGVLPCAELADAHARVLRQQLPRSGQPPFGLRAMVGEASW